MSANNTIYLIDGTAYIYRAYHAIRNLSNSNGMPTNAIFGFARMLIKLIEDRDPTHAVMLFDARGPTFRHGLFKDYKANRPPMPEDMAAQIPYIKEVTRGFGLPIMEKEGYEADDLVGTIARSAEEAGFSIVMVTGDKDFMQLVTDRATIWDPMKERLIDQRVVEEEFGVEPGQMIDVQGLAGDASDNVPGVPGIGMKTALALIQEYGSIEGLYDRLDGLTKKKQRENLITYRDQAFLSKRLVTIDTRVPIDFSPQNLAVGEEDREALFDLFKELEFRQLQQAYKAKTDRSKKNYRAIFDSETLDRLIDCLESAPVFAIDTETTSKHPMRAELVGLSFAVKPDEAFYIPLGHAYPGVPEQLEAETVLDRLRPILESPEHKKVGQNIKYDWIVLDRCGVDLDGVVFDTMVASYLLNPTKRAHNLDQIALDYLDYTTTTYAEVAGKGKGAKTFDQVGIDQAVPYACEDADITLAARKVLSDGLAADGLVALFEELEMPLVPVLKRMEMKGVRIDTEHLKALSRTFNDQLDQLEEQIHALAGEPFNIKSSQQLGRILFEKLGLPVQKKTRKTAGYSTDVDVLTALAEMHELPVHVLRHRMLAKLKSTYADALIELVNPDTGRIHTSYNQTVTATGRLSSSDPNLQNIPIRTEEGREIRSAFIPKDGWALLSADYSQIELRILAHCSEDPILIEAFERDEDIHSRTAAEVFQVLPMMLDAELRRQAKAINFGIVYGMSPFGLSKQLGISQKMAKTYIDMYFSRYAGVKAFMEQTIETAREQRKASTLMGRIRQLPDIDSKNRTIRQFAERTAINTPIQGSAADLIKAAMLRADAVIKEKGLRSAMLLTVHDELVFEVPPEEMNTVRSLIRGVMENVWELKVPLKVNMAEGGNWAEAH